MSADKIDTSEWVRIRRSGNRMYLPIAADIIKAFGLKVGDLLHVQIKEVRRKEEE